MITCLKNKKVILAMSGGVDSSVAAALLKKAGFNVVGVYMRLWKDSKRGEASKDEKRARQVAKKLNIPFYVFNFENEFKKKIVDNFLKEFKAGRTPNPCVVCNKEIKFGLLFQKLKSLKADYIATGHYARLRREIPNSKLQFSNKFKIQNPAPLKAGRPLRPRNEARGSLNKVERQNSKLIYKLYQAKDKNKDQSYFLWKLNQKILAKTLFPLGDYTKIQVKEMARKFDLPVVDIPESQEICFITDANLSGFLKSRIKTNKGKIITADGKIVGEHQGLWFYTIGQRRGIELPDGPYYVLDKDIKKNILIATKKEKDLFKKELIAEDVNWVSEKKPKLPIKTMAQIRYGHKPVSAKIMKDKGNNFKVFFSRYQRALTPGQSVVFYKSKELLGGGIIK